MIRAVFIGGSHPRHRYYFDIMRRFVSLQGAIIQGREGMIPEPPQGLERRDLENWRRHFEERDAVEKKIFGNPAPLTCETLNLENINTREAAEFIWHYQPNLVLVFGCGMIKKPLIDALPEDTINLHLGLSPRYRGAATLFWPFYFLEPNYAGCTFHRITREPDAGEIMHQCKPSLLKGDGVHNVSARAVVQAANDMAVLLNERSKGEQWKWKKQRNTGKCFLSTDFRAQHLRMIYDVYDNKISDKYLEGKINPPEPVLFRENLFDANNIT